MKRHCIWETHGFERKDHKKITYSMGSNKTEIDFVLVGKNSGDRERSTFLNPVLCALIQVKTESI